MLTNFRGTVSALELYSKTCSSALVAASPSPVSTRPLLASHGTVGRVGTFPTGVKTFVDRGQALLSALKMTAPQVRPANAGMAQVSAIPYFIFSHLF